MPEDNIECEAFTMMSINSLLLCENKYYSFVLNCKGEVVKWKSLGKIPSSSFNYCKRMTYSLPPLHFKKSWKFSPGAFSSTEIQLATKEYLKILYPFETDKN